MLKYQIQQVDTYAEKMQVTRKYDLYMCVYVCTTQLLQNCFAFQI